MRMPALRQWILAPERSPEGSFITLSAETTTLWDLSPHQSILDAAPTAP
jgi:hypothetical protein